MMETTGTSVTLVTGTITQDAEVKSGTKQDGTQYEFSVAYIDVAKYVKKAGDWFHTKYRVVGYKTENSTFQFDRILELKKGDHVQAVGELEVRAYMSKDSDKLCCARSFSPDTRITTLKAGRRPVNPAPRNNSYDNNHEDIPF